MQNEIEHTKLGVDIAKAVNQISKEKPTKGN
jgi:hypothetical protein